MSSAVVALALAVLTTVAYAALAERLDYPSVRRRQLDVWAALVSFLCLGGIVYGGAAVGLRPRPPQNPNQSVSPAPTPRLIIDAAAGDSGTASLGAGLADGAAPGLLGGPPPGLVGLSMPTADAAGLVALAPAADPNRPVTPNAAVILATPTLMAPALGTLMLPPTASPTAAPPIASATRGLDVPSLTPVRPAMTRAVPTKVVATATSQPTQPLPTDEPPPLPSSTPSCGDPSNAALTMQGLTATPDRSGSDLLIRFKAQVRNGASFPVTLKDISATAVNRVAGSEQYGHNTLPDISIEPGALITLEGAVNLTKNPPPFGTTELCLSFALDSCGQRADRAVRQCTAVHGF